MFTAYIDESGTDERSRFIGIGGVIADAEKWARFENAWRQCLSDFDVPYSHMKEFAGSTGAFRKWNSPTKEFEPQRREFMKSLCDCIVDNVAYSFGAVMTRQHYAKLVPENFRREMGSPYTFWGRHYIARVGVWAQTNSPDESVNMIFERGQPEQSLRLQHGIVSANEEFRKQYPVGSLTFADKYVRKRPQDSALPLQAADIVAYELVKQWRTIDREVRIWQTNRDYTKASQSALLSQP